MRQPGFPSVLGGRFVFWDDFVRFRNRQFQPEALGLPPQEPVRNGAQGPAKAAASPLPPRAAAILRECETPQT